MKSTEAITEATVEYVSRLANLEVHQSERAELALQLSRIVEHVQELNKVDVSGVEPTTQILDTIKHAIREDRAAARTGSGNAGKTVKHFKVPKVITER